jgi:putative sigma-54 modulation protein
MKINIQSVHFDADKKLIQFIEEKIEKLTHFHDGIIEVDVILRIEKDSNAHLNKLVEIKMHVSGHDLFAKKNCISFEEATDEAVEAILKQLKKHKEKDRKG